MFKKLSLVLRLENLLIHMFWELWQGAESRFSPVMAGDIDCSLQN